MISWTEIGGCKYVLRSITTPLWSVSVCYSSCCDGATSALTDNNEAYYPCSSSDVAPGVENPADTTIRCGVCKGDVKSIGGG